MYSQTRIGPLDCTVAGPEFGTGKPDLTVVLCHGFGAPGTDLVPLTEELASAAGVDLSSVQFLYPAAPISLDAFGGFEGRAWWMINMQALAEMMGTNDFTQLRKSVPPGLVDAREMLNEFLQEVFETNSCKLDDLVIGGFSQGAMLTADVVLHAQNNPHCLVQFSGTLICEDHWRRLAPDHRGLRVLQSHGKYDPVLPYQAAQWLRDLFVENGCDVQFLPFDGVHTISGEALHALGKIITAATQDRSAS